MVYWPFYCSKDFIYFIFFSSSIILILATAYLFKLDTYIFPSSISGKVVDQNNDPLREVYICINDTCSYSDRDGNYLIGGLTYGKKNLKAQKINFQDFSETISVTRGRKEYDFNMSPAGFGNITIKLSTNNESLNYESLILKIDDEVIELNEEGFFSVTEFPIGEHKLIIKSSNYIDIEDNIEINEEDNEDFELLLEDAGDISFQVTNWINNQKINNIKLNFDNKEYVTEDGQIIIEDIIIQEKAKFDFTSKGYHSKTVVSDIKQGINNLINIEMVQTGSIIYVSSRSGNQTIYLSNYDGPEEKQLTKNQGDNYYPYKTNANTILFLSTRDNIKNQYGNLIPLVYEMNIDGTGLKKISKTDYNDYHVIGAFSFQAMKRVYVNYTYNQYQYNSQVLFGNIDGTNMNMIYEDQNYLDN